MVMNIFKLIKDEFIKSLNSIKPWQDYDGKWICRDSYWDHYERYISPNIIPLIELHSWSKVDFDDAIVLTLGFGWHRSEQGMIRTHQTILEWIDNNSIGYWTLDQSYWFEKEEDAVHFKLVYG